MGQNYSQLSDQLFIAANFRPHTYWNLVTASSAVTQHLSTIFIFLATFVRLKERYLDPRILVWISVSAFLVGYLTSEILEYHSTEQERYTNRWLSLT